MRTSGCWIGALSIAGLLLARGPALAAENLRLAPGLSFSDDSSDRFPIEGDRLDEATTGRGRVAVAFFGAAHCWNTNREAERIVALYSRLRDSVDFIVVNVTHPSPAQHRILEAHYRGTIPTIVVFAPDGTVTWARSGETAASRGDTGPLEDRIRRATGVAGAR